MKQPLSDRPASHLFDCASLRRARPATPNLQSTAGHTIPQTQRVWIHLDSSGREEEQAHHAATFSSDIVTVAALGFALLGCWVGLAAAGPEAPPPAAPAGAAWSWPVSGTKCPPSCAPPASRSFGAGHFDACFDGQRTKEMTHPLSNATHSLISLIPPG